jgi:hypothetical protein
MQSSLPLLGRVSVCSTPGPGLADPRAAHPHAPRAPGPAAGFTTHQANVEIEAPAT